MLEVLGHKNFNNPLKIILYHKMSQSTLSKNNRHKSSVFNYGVETTPNLKGSGLDDSLK